MADEDSVEQIFGRMRDWEESGRRLMNIAEQVKEKIGEAPLQFSESGEVFIHPDLARKLNEPGNEGPREFLRHMQRTGTFKDWHESASDKGN